MDTQTFFKNTCLPTPKLEETSAFTKFLKQNVENSRLLPRFPPTEGDASSSESTKFSAKDHKSPFCIESLLKSDQQQRRSPDRFPPLSPPSDSSPPPAFPAPLPQFPFPPQLLPYLLPSQQTPDYIQMEYLARQGVFLNSFPAFAGIKLNVPKKRL